MIKYNFGDGFAKEDFAIIHKPIVIRVNEFTEASAKIFSEEMERANQSSQDIIPIVIDSYGGQCYALMAMISEIKASPKKIATIVQGKAMSCGAILLTYGDDGLRFACPYATILIHNVWSGGVGTPKDIEVRAEEAKRLQNMLYQEMAKNCGHKRKNYFRDIIKENEEADWFITPESALEHNIVNTLGVPTLNVNINASYDLSL